MGGSPGHSRDTSSAVNHCQKPAHDPGTAVNSREAGRFPGPGPASRTSSGWSWGAVWRGRRCGRRWVGRPQGPELRNPGSLLLCNAELMGSHGGAAVVARRPRAPLRNRKRLGGRPRFLQKDRPESGFVLALASAPSVTPGASPRPGAPRAQFSRRPSPGTSVACLCRL